jgi:hypothetical protein
LGCVCVAGVVGFLTCACACTDDDCVEFSRHDATGYEGKVMRLRFGEEVIDKRECSSSRT